MRTAPKIILFLLAFCIVGGGINFWLNRNEKGTVVDKMLGRSEGTAGGGSGGDADIRIAINQWPGFVPGIIMNNGIAPNKNSANWKDFGFTASYTIMDDPVAMLKGYGRDDFDVIWSTIDSAATQLGGLKKGGQPTKVFLQVDWSRGGDGIVAKKSIRSVEDLRGKKIGLITQSPSEFLLIYALRNSSLDDQEQKAILTRLVGMDSPDALIAAFEAGQLDAIVTWEPNISAIVNRGGNAHVLLDTSTFANAISDVFMASEKFINENPELIQKFIQSWQQGIREFNRNPSNAAEVMMQNLPMFQTLGRDKTLDTIAKVKLTDMSDNAKTFALNGGEPLYDKIFNEATEIYASRGVLETRVSSLESKYEGHLQKVFASLPPEDQKATPVEEHTFSPKQREQAAKSTAKAVLNKQISIHFGTNQSTLSDSAKIAIKRDIVPLLEMASNAFVRIEGNTDNVGNDTTNKMLSYERAQAVVNYLVRLGFDESRLIPVGNGESKPVASNSSERGRARNRRTDIRVVAK